MEGNVSFFFVFVGVLEHIKFIYAFLRFVVKFALIVWRVRVSGPFHSISLCTAHHRSLFLTTCYLPHSRLGQLHVVHLFVGHINITNSSLTFYLLLSFFCLLASRIIATHFPQPRKFANPPRNVQPDSLPFICHHSHR